MNFDEYQMFTASTARYPRKGDGSVQDLMYPVLGLLGEAGEVAEKIKKLLRDKEGAIDADDRRAIAREIGDVLWYISRLSRELGVPLDEIARMNVTKLDDRVRRDVVHGSGDER